MIERLQKAIENNDTLVCCTRKEWNVYEKDVTSNIKYLTHYYYKFSDTACVGICLRGVCK